MKNKLMEVYDKQYDENFNKILDKGAGHEEAKSLMGLIFQKTEEALTKKHSTENIEEIFNNVRTHYGIC